MNKIEAIDLFSGAGGTTQGLKKAGIDVIAAVEIDKIASKTYHHNNPEVKLLIEDIRKIHKQDLPTIDKSDYLLLVACPPCQGFSTIRNGGQNDLRNELVFEYQRLIGEMKPDFLLMENVAGMTGKKGKKIFQLFCENIEKYYHIKYEILNAADYGVPQRRKRLVLHGIKKEVTKKLNVDVSLPSKTHSKNGEKGLEPWINADVILDLPSIGAGETYDGNLPVYNHTANNLSEINKKRITIIRKGGGSRDALPDELVLKCHKNSSGHSDVYGILRTNEPSVTITGGCMSYSKGRFGHPTQDRALSAREAARLQSFDDDYIFFGTKVQLAKQIGNAVPVKLAEASGKYFINLIGGYK